MDNIEAIRTAYNMEYAEGYDDISRDKKINYAQYLSEIASFFEQKTWKRGHVLDLGCGTGLLSEYLRGDFDFTGVDISPHMLASAKKRGYKVYESSIQNEISNFSQNSFDYVISMSVLYHIDKITPLVHKMCKIARKAVYFTLEEITEDFKKACMENHQLKMYNHINNKFDDIISDYFIKGWKSPRQNGGIPKIRILCLDASTT